MMTFRTAKNAMQQLLGDNAHGRFRVLGYVTQSKHADEIKDNKRLVQVLYDQGNFNKQASAYYGPASHDVSLKIVLSASAASKIDITKLNDESATDEERAQALDSMTTASEQADIIIDELIDIVFNIIMDARFDACGLPAGTIANRWIDSIRKYDAAEHGNLVVKTALLDYSCRVSESFIGDTGNMPDTVVIDSDHGSGTGVKVENVNT